MLSRFSLSKLGARQSPGASDDADYLSSISPQKGRGRPTHRWPATFRHFRHSRRGAAGISAGAIRDRGERGDFPHFPLVRYPLSGANDAFEPIT
jgi:hypothetical protein